MRTLRGNIMDVNINSLYKLGLVMHAIHVEDYLMLLVQFNSYNKLSCKNDYALDVSVMIHWFLFLKVSKMTSLS